MTTTTEPNPNPTCAIKERLLLERAWFAYHRQARRDGATPIEYSAANSLVSGNFVVLRSEFETLAVFRVICGKLRTIDRPYRL